MSEQTNKVVMCQNGHRQKMSGAKFCIYCGQALKTVTFQAHQNPAQNNRPANPPPANYPAPAPPNQQQHNQNFRQPPTHQQNFQPPAPPPFNQQQANQQNFQPPPFVPPQQFIQPPQQQQYMQQQQPYQMVQAMQCYVCGGNGQGLSEKTVICKECNWLRPLVPGYQVDSSAFEWAADGKAMSALRSMKTLNAAARAVSEKVGRRWIEVTFNGVLLGEKQLPHIYAQAVRAARILGMSHMPDVYVSGERAWDCLTFGTDKDSFIVIGSALAGNFQGADMMFLLAREMGHCRAGHALWKTVIRFLLGEQGPGKGMMAGGVFNAILNPTALIEGALEVPLLAWARQAEITADRAGLLALGEEEIARRVLLSWSLKSSLLYRQMNIEAWLEQQSAEDDGYSRLSELTTTSTPYIGPRLKLLSEFAQSPELKYWRKMITDTIRRAAPPKAPAQATANPSAKPVQPSDLIKLKCASCQTVMQIPQKVLAGKDVLPVKCPNKECGKITRLKKSNQPATAAAAPKLKQKEENMNYGD